MMLRMVLRRRMVLSMTAPLRSSQPPVRKRGKSQPRRTVLFDQENATAVWRALHELMPMKQYEIAEKVEIAPSAVTEWMAGRRQITFERLPALAEIYGVDPLLFLTPVEVVEKALRPHQDAVAKFRSEELERARQSLATLERYTKAPAQAHLFQPDSPEGKRRGHLQSVSAEH